MKPPEVIEGVLSQESPVDRDFEALPHPRARSSMLETTEHRQLLRQPLLYGCLGRVYQVEPGRVVLLEPGDPPFFDEGVTRAGEHMRINSLVVGASIGDFLL